MLPASTGERKQRDVTQGPPRRPHGRDPAADRPLAARRRRLRGARRAHDLPRLRRAAGRRRHALRVDHRRLRGAALACDALRADGVLERSPLTGSVAAVSCGIVGGVAAARPRLRRGLDRRGRRERRDDRRRRPRRGAGHRRAHAALARAPRRAARARRGRHRASCAPSRSRRSPAAGAMTAPVARARHAQRAQGARVRRAARRGIEVERAARRRRAAARDGDDVRRERAGQGPRGGAATGAAAIADDSGIEAAALGGAPGRALGALRRRGRHRRARTSPSCSPRRRPGSALAYVCALAYVDPRRRRAALRGPLRRARWRPSRAATGGFGYDPVFVPDDERHGRTMAELPTPRRTRSATAGGPRGRCWRPRCADAG